MMTMKYVAFLLVVMGALTSLAPTGAAQIRLNEILADPATDWDQNGSVNSKDDEWVELINVGPSPVDLSRFRITDESAGTDWRFELGGTLAPGEIRVVFGSEVLTWQSANGVSSFGFSLNNSGDTVYLYEEPVGGTATIVDSYTYAAAEVTDDRSVGRQPVGTGNWYVFDGMNPYTGSGSVPATGCMPSPGNTVECTTPVEVSSWGAIKSLFRSDNDS
jgi:hypothetical protein